MKTVIQFSAVVLFLAFNFSAQSQCANPSNIYSFTYNGKTYEVVKQNETWINAASCAVSRGGYLAEINDANEQSAIYNELINNASITFSSTTAPDGGGGAYVWLGGNDLASEGDWIWDGDNDNVGPQFWQGLALGGGGPVGGLYNNFSSQEPDNFLGQDALALSLDGWPFGVASQWNDINHTNAMYYLIEYDSTCVSTSSAITETACNSYTSPSGNYIWTTSNTYVDTILNAANCDSIITINLTINSVSDLTTSISGAAITANNANGTYRWLDCDAGNTAIAGETGQSFTPSANGNYAVEITESGCVDTSECVEVNTVGIDESTFGSGFTLYPNPTRGDFSVDLGREYNSISVSLTDLSGRIIVLKSYDKTDVVQLEINQPAGMYFVIIESDDQKAIIQLIKE